jgi:hypothetical protein
MCEEPKLMHFRVCSYIIEQSKFPEVLEIIQLVLKSEIQI